MKSGLCPKCGSKEVISNVEVCSGENEAVRPVSLSVPLPRAHTRVVFHHSETSEVRAWVCGACGYVELYAIDYPSLLDAHLKSAARGG